MKPVIKASIRERRNAMTGWIVGISAFIAINILVYSSISTQARSLNKALDNLPAGAKALFGSANGDFLSPVGYLNSKLFYLILPLLFTLLAVTLASRLLAREEEDGSIELLLARPLSRTRLLFAKLTAGLVLLLGVGLVTFAVTAICIKTSHYETGLGQVAGAYGLMLLLSLLFGSVAWAVIGIGRFGRRAAVGIACFVALGSYLFTSLESFAGWLKWPAKVLPYHYYDSAGVLNGHINWRHVSGMIIAAIVILALAFIGFRRRDLA
jgi:ABC-2 type transport system permease protein